MDGRLQSFGARGETVVRHLLTDPMPRVVGKLHHAIAASTHRYWTAQGGLSPLLPVTTGSVSSPMGRGSDSTSVQVLLDGTPTYLADSMQFHLELTVRVVDAPAYYLMSSFRGEKADATHLPQFFHSEAELDR